MATKTRRSILSPELLSLALLVTLVLYSGPAGAQAPFFQGKTITIVQGRDPGGTGDIRVKAVIPFLQKYIPGNPNILSEYMPGGDAQRARTNSSRSISQGLQGSGISQRYKKLTADDATPLMPEAHEKAIQEVPRDPEIAEIFKKLVGAGPLPPR